MLICFNSTSLYVITAVYFLDYICVCHGCSRVADYRPIAVTSFRHNILVVSRSQTLDGKVKSLAMRDYHFGGQPVGVVMGQMCR